MILSHNKLFLFISITSLFLHTLSYASTQDLLNGCALIKQDSARLKCYDSIPQPRQTEQKTHYLQPPKEFLSSELRTTLHESEYTLSIADFVTLIKRVKLENGNPIIIAGWVRQHDSFILKINMRHNISLAFTHIKTNKENISLLLPVIVDGDNVDPSVFIMTIAAMTSD